MTNEELVKVQLFYNIIRKDFVDLEANANSLVTVQREILNFDWSEDTIYNNWKEEFMSIEKIEGDDKVEDDDKEEGTKVETTSITDDKDKKDPQVAGDDSSLSLLIATYPEELEQ